MTNTLTTAALAGAEATINRALRYDPATRQKLAKLEGQVLAVHLSTPSVCVYLAPEANRLRLLSHWEGPVATELRGSLPALVKVALSRDSNLKGSGVEISGGTGMLLELRQILQGLDIDWEELLSELLGDVAGHQGAEMLRSAKRWLEGRGQSSQRLVSEFVTEELQLLPSRTELEDFYRNVDQLRLDLDRAEARLQLLKSQQSNPPNAEQKD